MQINSGVISGNIATAFFYSEQISRAQLLPVDFFGYGGGIFNVGNLNIGPKCEISKNQANSAYGIFHGTYEKLEFNSLSISDQAVIESNITIDTSDYPKFCTPDAIKTFLLLSKNCKQIVVYKILENNSNKEHYLKLS